MRTTLVLWLLAAPSHASAQFLQQLSGPRLASELTSADVNTRRAAARRLGVVGDSGAALRALSIALAGERDPTARRFLAESIGRRGSADAVEPLISALQNAAHPDRSAVARMLGRLQDRGAIDALVEALRDDDIRTAVIEALGQVGPSAVGPLSTAVQEPGSRLWAIEALGAVGDRRATGLLIQQLQEGDAVVRVATLRALEKIGDRRAAEAVATIARGAESDVSSDAPASDLGVLAVTCLGAIGDETHVPLLIERMATNDIRMRRAALRSLVHLSPRRAAELMEGLVAVPGEPLAPLAIELALESTHPRMVPLLFGLVREGSRAPEALSALAEVDGGAGISVLVEEAAEGSHQFEARRALAVALRAWQGELGTVDYAAGIAVLRTAEPEPSRPLRRMFLRAIARDAEVRDEVVSALEHSAPSTRALAAQAAEALGERDLGSAVRAAIERETEPEPFRRLAMASLRLEEPIPLRVTGRWFDIRETLPEASWVAARLLRAERGIERRDARELRRKFRRDARDPEPRVRAGALRALSIAGDRQAYRVALQALEDPVREVRHAAAYTLGTLAVRDAVPRLESLWRIEANPLVADAILDAIEAPRRRRLDPLGFQGTSALRVRIAAVETLAASDRITVDVILPDTTWMRLQTLDGGELVLVDLPEGVADVRVRLE
ncbi:MAG: HEAT repeat domain-containing protein [Myxococcota bacterium]